MLAVNPSCGAYMRLLVLAVLTLTACHAANASTADTPGRVVWRDAVGSNIPALDGAHFFDAHGYVWTLGDKGASSVQLFAGLRYYASADCTGPAYVKYEYTFPRLVVRYIGDSAYYSYPDAPAAAQLAARSTGGLTCEPSSETLDALALADLVRVGEPPVPPGVPPYHPEYAY